LKKLSIRLLGFLALAMLLISFPARAQERFIQSSDFFVVTADKVSIHVHRKVGVSGFDADSNKVPVLLIHGTWGDGRTWDFPGRSVMDNLALLGYDAYALDLRGMGSSDKPKNYFTIDILNRVNDAAAVASYILTNTGRAPVVLGWSQGGVITGLLAASAPQLVAGVGLFSVPEDGFSVPTDLLPVLGQIIMSGVDRFLPTEAEINEVAFGPLMSSQAEDTFYSLSDPDSVLAIEEAASPVFFNAALVPAWPRIHVPALVADGALDLLVGPQSSQALFHALGSEDKHLVIFPRNSHGWFLEDNHAITILVIDLFLLQFRS